MFLYSWLTVGDFGSLMDRHTGPVWQVSWAHPKYGHILASSSYDGKVLIWKEQPAQGNTPGGWIKIKEHTLHTASGMNFSARLVGFSEAHVLQLTLFRGRPMNSVLSSLARLQMERSQF